MTRLHKNIFIFIISVIFVNIIFIQYISKLNNLVNNELEIPNNVINVKQFGAKGNGLSNDTQAIQNAINYAKKNGKSVYFPSGTYLITKTIKVNQISIYGAYGWNNQGYTSLDNSAVAQLNSTRKQGMPILLFDFTNADGHPNINLNGILLEGAGASLKGFSFMYANQVKYRPEAGIFDPKKVVKFAPTIEVKNGDNQLVEDVVFLNSFTGIHSLNTSGIQIKNVLSQTFGDTIRLENSNEYNIKNVRYRAGDVYFGSYDVTIQPTNTAVINLINTDLGFIDNVQGNRHNCLIMATTDWGLIASNIWADEIKYPLIIKQEGKKSNSTKKFRILLSNVEIGEGNRYARDHYIDKDKGTVATVNQDDPPQVLFSVRKGNLYNTDYEYNIQLQNCTFWNQVRVEGTTNFQALNCYFFNGVNVDALNDDHYIPYINGELTNCFFNKTRLILNGDNLTNIRLYNCSGSNLESRPTDTVNNKNAKIFIDGSLEY